MEYIAALKERSEIQDRKIAELENHGRTVSIPPTDTAAEITLSGRNSLISGSTVDVNLAEIKADMHKMAETVSSQETSVASLTRHIANNSGGGGGGNGGVGGHIAVNKDNHECKKCNRMMWHKEADFPEYERNKHKSWVGWESALK